MVVVECFCNVDVFEGFFRIEVVVFGDLFYFFRFEGVFSVNLDDGIVEIIFFGWFLNYDSKCVGELGVVEYEIVWCDEVVGFWND